MLIAAGARPIVPPISGLVETGFHTSDSIMRLDPCRQRLGIIGGGFIAAEMGHVFAGLGSEVTMFARSAGSAPRFRPRHRRALHGGVRHACRPPSRHAPTAVRRTADGIEIACGEAIDRRRRAARGDRPRTEQRPARRGRWRHRTARSRHDRGRRHDGDERRRRLGDRRHRQRPSAQASGQRRGQGGVLEHRPSGRSTPAELQGGAERRLLQPADRHGRPDRAAGRANRAGRSSSVGATTRARRTDGRWSTRRRSPRCSSTSTPG